MNSNAICNITVFVHDSPDQNRDLRRFTIGPIRMRPTDVRALASSEKLILSDSIRSVNADVR